jgi:glutathione S-transferase
MRARMALVVANIQCEVYDIDFKNKPDHMLEISPKGTVPVLQTIKGIVIDESLDIVFWALNQSDPEGYLHDSADSLISENDGSFKKALDRYKYPNRFPDEDCSNARHQAQDYLDKLDDILKTNNNLLGDQKSLADICIFPFIRQCANVDRKWFDSLPYLNLQNWLQRHVESQLFQHVFQKQADNPYMLL